VVLRIARDDDSLRMAMLVVVADEDGDAMFVMMGMYGHTDIVRVALFDGGALRVSRVRSWFLYQDRQGDTLNATWGRTAALAV
jgi:hypothetical protein